VEATTLNSTLAGQSYQREVAVKFKDNKKCFNEKIISSIVSIATLLFALALLCFVVLFTNFDFSRKTMEKFLLNGFL
jgi:hypothetical protein